MDIHSRVKGVITSEYKAWQLIVLAIQPCVLYHCIMPVVRLILVNSFALLQHPGDNNPSRSKIHPENTVVANLPFKTEQKV